MGQFRLKCRLLISSYIIGTKTFNRRTNVIIVTGNKNEHNPGLWLWTLRRHKARRIRTAVAFTTSAVLSLWPLFVKYGMINFLNLLIFCSAILFSVWPDASKTSNTKRSLNKVNHTGLFNHPTINYHSIKWPKALWIAQMVLFLPKYRATLPFSHSTTDSAATSFACLHFISIQAGDVSPKIRRTHKKFDKNFEQKMLVGCIW